MENNLKNPITLDDLAIMVNDGFYSMKSHFNERFNSLEKRMDSLEKRMDSLEKRMDGLEKRMDSLEKRMDGLEKRMDGLESKLVFIQSEIEDIKERLFFTVEATTEDNNILAIDVKQLKSRVRILEERLNQLKADHT